MKYTLVTFGACLLLATFGYAQQQGQPLPNSPPYGTPPTFPDERRSPTQPMPPDQPAPPPQLMSATAAEHQIREHLNSEPVLKDTAVEVMVDDNSVMLTGTVDTERQHDVALRIAQSYAGGRKIVDKIKIGQQTL